VTTNSFIFRVDDPRIAILLNPGLDFLFDRFLGSICATVRPKPRSFFNLLDGEYKFFRNSI